MQLNLWRPEVREAWWAWSLDVLEDWRAVRAAVREGRLDIPEGHPRLHRANRHLEAISQRLRQHIIDMSNRHYGESPRNNEELTVGVRVIQLSLSRVGNQGICFECVALNGEQLCRVALHEEVLIEAVPWRIAAELAVAEQTLKFVLPDGTLLNTLSRKVRVKELVDPGLGNVDRILEPELEIHDPMPEIRRLRRLRRPHRLHPDLRHFPMLELLPHRQERALGNTNVPLLHTNISLLLGILSAIVVGAVLIQGLILIVGAACAVGQRILQIGGLSLQSIYYYYLYHLLP